MNKQELRARYLAKRKGLTAEACSLFNIQLYNRFFSSVDLSFVHVVHTYLPIQKNNEPDTWMILDRIRREFPHIRISLPRIADDGEMENLYFEGLHQLRTNNLGIQEPQQGVPTPVEKIDMVLVPLVAVDQSGHRVGYGKGYYDRFLNKCQPDCKKIGLSFFEAVDQVSDAGPLDVKLDACLTPERTLNFTDLP